MEKNTFIYFGDDLFHKLENFKYLNCTPLSETVNWKMFNSIASSDQKIIDDVYLGWSYIIYRIGKVFT